MELALGVSGKGVPDSMACFLSNRNRRGHFPPSERMYWTRAQRSLSGSCPHGGMAPRPAVIFRNRSPSADALPRFDVQSAGFGLSATAAGPSPLPPAPWQATDDIC